MKKKKINTDTQIVETPKFKFYHLTDTHLYAANELGAEGKIFEFRCATDQKCMAESEAINDATFDMLIADKEVETIVVSGDLTFDGEVASHKAIAKKFERLQMAGKKVYVTFATHDYMNEARVYKDDGVYLVDKFSHEKLREFYSQFGWNNCYAEHKNSFSYAVKPAPGIRFLLLNDDGDGRAFCGFYDDLLEWIKAQCEEAKEQGERVIAFTHHPVTPPSLIYPIFSHRDMLGGFETTAPFLADCGVEFIFTGHTHMQSISKLETENGNKLYHINTGCPISYPAPMRRVTVEDNGIDIKTVSIDSFNWNLKGMDAKEYMKAHFVNMLKDIFYSMEHDIEKFKLLADGFSMSADTVDKLKPILKLAGKFVNGITFGGASKLLFTKGVTPEVKDIKVRDFVLEIICNMYGGVKPYNPDTAEYKAFMPLVKRLGFIKLKDSEGNPVTLTEIVDDLMYITDGIDNTNVFLEF